MNALAHPGIAISPALILTADTSGIRWIDNESALLGATPFAEIWPDALDIRQVQAFWNANSGRFFLAAVGKINDDDDNIFIAMSRGDDPADGWDTMHSHVAANLVKFDYLSAGISGDGIYFTVDTEAGSWYLRMGAEDILNYTQFVWGGRVSSSEVRFACNERSGAGDPRLVLCAAKSGSMSRLWFWAKKSEAAGGPSRMFWLDVPWQSTPPLVQQLGSQDINVGDRDFYATAINNDSCWMAQTMRIGDHAIVRWYEIDLRGWPDSAQTPALKQYGDIDLGPGVHAYQPAIAVDTDGNACLVYSTSSATSPVTVMRAFRLAADPPGLMGTPVMVKQGEAPAGTPWGPYSSITSDKVGSFWLHAAYPTVDGWATVLHHTTLAPVQSNPADLNQDGVVDTADLGILIGQFGTAGPEGDINHDGVVDTADLSILLGEMNKDQQ